MRKAGEERSNHINEILEKTYSLIGAFAEKAEEYKDAIITHFLKTE